VSAEAFGAEDADRDGFWSREEFLVFYRHQLVSSRQPVGTDLDAEITRIQALKRVESGDPTRKPRCETSARSADPDSLNERFETILADVEAKCASRRAGRQDFQRLRNLVVLNGRAAARGSSTPGPALQSAVLEAIDRIEKHSVQGLYSQDEFAALRRASSAESVSTATATSNAGGRGSVESPQDGRSSVRIYPVPARPNPEGPNSSPTHGGSAPEHFGSAPAQVGSAPGQIGSAPAQVGSAPAGPAAGRQSTAPAPAPPPKPQPHPAPIRPSNEPPDRSKP
jgi:hypothetical protein